MPIKRISLITPPYHAGVVESAGTWLNLGFVYIAGALRKAGYEVDYYDAMSYWHKWQDIQKRIEDFEPHIVATTAFTASIVDAVKLLQLAKDINPQILTVIGNVHPTFSFNELLKQKNSIDFVIRGEGESTFPKLCDCLNANDDPAKVNGLAYRKNSAIIVTPQSLLHENLDILSPAWDLVDWPIYSYYPKVNSTLAIVSSSRGCTQNCSFCSQRLFWQKSWRSRSAENFVEELEYLNRTFGVDVAMLADETPTLNRKRWEKILDLLIERQPGVKLLMETRVDDIIRDEDIMDKYNRAGIEHIYVGVEAGTQATLDIFKKGTKVNQSKRAIDLINQADIVSETSFVLGMPDDTKESIAATVDLAIHYNPDMAFFLAIAPWPYADLYPELEEYVEITDFRKYNLIEPIIKPKNMTLDEVRHELAESSKKFFMHKFANLKELSPWKQEFMVSVFKILINNSYLSEHMRSMANDKKVMPEEIKMLLRKAKNIPPIP